MLKLNLKSLLGYNLLAKNVKKILVVSIMLANIPIESFAGTLSQDTRFETFEGSNINISDILEDDTIEMEVEGNTVVNLNNVDVTKSTLNICAHCHIGDFTNERLVSGKEYSIKWVTDAEITPQYIAYVTTNNLEKSLVQGVNENTFVKFTLPSDFAKFRLYVNSSKVQQSVNFKMLLLEGDWTNKGSIDYFEGIKSVGEKDNEHSILLSSIENKVEFLDRGTVASADGASYDRTDRLRTNLIEVSSDKIDIIGLGNSETSLVFCYDKNKNYLGKARDDWNKDREKIQLKNNTKYIYIVWRVADNIQILPEDYSDIIICESVNRESVDVKLNEPLRGISDKIKDRILKKNGTWYIERRVGQIKGSEMNKITLSDSNDNYIKVRVEDLFNVRKNSSESPILNNKFLFAGTSGNYSIQRNFENIEVVETMNEGHANYNIHRGICYITLSKSKATNLDAAKTWLKNSGLVIVYELENPVYEPIPYNLAVNIFEGKTCITNNSIVPPNIKVTVDRILNRVAESIEIFKNSPTMHNLSIARMWINAMDDSSKKDAFQNEVDNVGVKDLTIPPKVVTSNMDIYIKSENMLSMSLNTNSIMFDGYSGVDEMEKLNAVNITVNSSLPYDLNAYLPQNISNGDGSKNIDIDVLNIRESGKSSYQRFNGLNSKLILNDNCAEGNNKVHAIDLKLASDKAHKADVYKTVIKFEIAQK